MKIKVQNTTEKEVEITLPHYRVHGSTFYKVITETDILEVCTWEQFRNIRRGQYTLNSAFINGSTECTAQEFNEAYNQVKSLINVWND